MLRIALCDDIPEQLDIMENAVRTYFADSTYEIKISRYDNAMLFLDAFEEEMNFDIVLLDICMPGMLGTDVATEMRNQKSRAEIIFLSTSDEFAVDAFGVQAAHYLVKPFTQKQFDQAMNRVMESIRQRHSKKIIFRLVGGGIQVEEINDILFVESKGHIQKVYTHDGAVLETRQALAQLLATLDSISPFSLFHRQSVYQIRRPFMSSKAIISNQGYQIPLAKTENTANSRKNILSLFLKNI